MRMRLFIAADINDEQREKLAEVQNMMKNRVDDVRWVRAPALHITLKFLGKVEIPVKNIITLLEHSVHRFGAFNISLEGWGVFPHFRRPRVIWVGIGRGNDELQALNRMINHSFAGSGLDFAEGGSGEKKFLPHITIGRIRNPAKDATAALQEMNDGKFPVIDAADNELDYINLYRSILSPQGAEYISMAKIYLK